LLAYSSLFALISVWLRNIGATVAVNVGSVFLLSTLLMATNYITGGSLTLSDYWLTENITVLASLTPDIDDLLRAVIVGLSYIVVSAIVGSILFKTQDIK